MQQHVDLKDGPIQDPAANVQQTVTARDRLATVSAFGRNFGSLSHAALLLYCGTAALSIALHQTAVVVAVLSWVGFRAFSPGPARDRGQILGVIGYPILCWLVISYISTFLGVNPGRAIPEILKSTFYVLLPFCVFDSLLSTGLTVPQITRRIQWYLLALFTGQAAAALHSLISEAVGYQIPPRVPGPVTESGQLVLLLPLVAVLILHRKLAKETTRSHRTDLFVAGAAVICAFLMSWPQVAGFARGGIAQIFLGFGFVGAIAFFVRWKGSFSEYHFESGAISRRMLWGLGVVLFCAFVVNLKRGPWFAVFIELVVLGALYSRKLLIAVVACAMLLLVGIEPIRTRATQFVADFSISGGRQSMWELGVDLARSYPLGLGPNNAEFMRQVDPTLPPTHRHMHNNFLNVAVESGWIGLAAYIWWMYAIVLLAMKTWWRSRFVDPNENETAAALGILSLGMGLALIGWQLAGIVEYNFGDGEIRLLAFFCMGLILVSAQLLGVTGVRRTRE